MSKKLGVAITIVITLGLVLVGFLIFKISYFRTIESLIDLFSSINFYIYKILKLQTDAAPTVTDYSKVIKWTTFLPEDFTKFAAKAKQFFILLFNGENFKNWGKQTSLKIGSTAKFLTIILPCLLLVIFAIKRLYAAGNTNHNKDTMPLKVFKLFVNFIYYPLKKILIGYIQFLKSFSWIWKLWLTIIIIQLNLASVIIEFIAYYLYFSVSFRFDTLYIQFIKLIIDLQVVFKYFPWWSLILFAWIVFDRFRQKIAIGKLKHFDARNCGFINELPIVSITCGSMGRKKTTMITDMALSQEVMFRQKALEIIQKNDIKFPYFPWICFELELKKCIEYGTVFNLATVKEWVKKKESRFEKYGNSKLQLYGYDYNKYSLEYDDGLKITGLFEVLETYALSYFIYIMQSSLIVANYSVRTDNKFLDEGNFPIWTFDFFPKKYPVKSRYSHILDFDVLRLGKKVIQNNPNAGSFEFGVVAITEIGKERGNNLELKEIKKSTDEANQKNDLFNSWLKMCRHSATVDNFSFIKVFTDEQRPESWGSDARDLCDIVQIVSSGKQKLALPFYTLEEMISTWVFDKVINLYYDFRFRRGDNTLLLHLLKAIAAFAFKRNVKIFNKYGYSILKIEKERGTMDNKPENKKYYLMNRKIYSNRFSTDCFSDYFNDMAKKSKLGLNDYMEYMTEKATVDELKKQNSYFIRSLYTGADEENPM